MRNWARARWFWVIPLGLLVTVALYSARQVGNDLYWQSAMGNLLATVLGIAAGVPVALQIERWRAAREERGREAEARKRQRQVLRLLADELKYDRETLAERDPTIPAARRPRLQVDPLKTDLWDAFTASGDIGYLDDPHLLGVIADAYAMVKVVMSIENLCYAVIHGENPRHADGTYSSQRLWEDARRLDAELTQMIAAAIGSTDSELQGG